MSPAVYRSRPTKRRTFVEMQILHDSLYAILEQDHPMTVRQLFYRLVSRGLILKDENQYKHTVVRLLGNMRCDGEIPFGWIADNTRWMRKPRSYSSLEEALKETARTYRRKLWDTQSAYVEIWLEKDALAGVLYDVTALYDVPLMVTRGYASLSFLHEAAEAIQSYGKPAFLYYLGDYDPSGVNIPQVVEQRLREFAPDADITFQRIAVTEEQVEDWDLPTRPTKASDSRAAGFQGESVEVDAIPPHELRALVQSCIAAHLDQEALGVLAIAEKSERDILLGMYGRHAGNGNQGRF